MAKRGGTQGSSVSGVPWGVGAGPIELPWPCVPPHENLRVSGWYRHFLAMEVVGGSTPLARSSVPVKGRPHISPMRVQNMVNGRPSKPCFGGFDSRRPLQLLGVQIQSKEETPMKTTLAACV